MCCISGLWMFLALWLGWTAVRLAKLPGAPIPEEWERLYQPDRKTMRWTLAALAMLAACAMVSPIVYGMVSYLSH